MERRAGHKARVAGQGGQKGPSRQVGGRRGARTRHRQEADPADAVVQRELAELARKKRADKESEKRLARKMFG